MRIGHINLATSISDAGEHFIRLVENLDRQGLEQYVLVANPDLARRVNVYPRVEAGPVVRAPVLAYCLMPDIDVAHAHDTRAGQAGLLLLLTRSIPYVLTQRSSAVAQYQAITRATLGRAACVICPDASLASELRSCADPVALNVIADISHDSLEVESPDRRLARQHAAIYEQAAASPGLYAEQL